MLCQSEQSLPGSRVRFRIRINMTQVVYYEGKAGVLVGHTSDETVQSLVTVKYLDRHSHFRGRSQQGRCAPGHHALDNSRLQQMKSHTPKPFLLELLSQGIRSPRRQWIRQISKPGKSIPVRLYRVNQVIVVLAVPRSLNQQGSADAVRIHQAKQVLHGAIEIGQRTTRQIDGWVRYAVSRPDMDVRVEDFSRCRLVSPLPGRHIILRESGASADKDRERTG